MQLIHVAGINAWWWATRRSVTTSRNAVDLALFAGVYRGIAWPLIGSGHGPMSAASL